VTATETEPSKKRILVIEVEPDIVRGLRDALEFEGFEIEAESTGRAGVETARARLPDLVLLDLMLPDVSGIEVCRRLKSETATRELPIVMVTAKGDEVDRVVGFELGADDYVVKPYSLRELLLRVDAVLRRRTPAQAGGSKGPLVFGKLRVDREAHRVWVDEEEITLTALELRLLSTLLERRGRVQSRLREKLGSAGPYIETVRGVGYRFTPATDHASAVGNSNDDEP